ncbi:accessory gland protein Acp29AB-like [Drosophila rhopaloa]|uniref:Accessory gland protein Acp29AB-like n=1 Tax=Drosophila rhopaloa TaxID=1041015 RepID=A0A6P4EJJ0_DRORH|nr:accessory gland protein Acp29AB-like [Drosophila rhopaloa]
MFRSATFFLCVFLALDLHGSLTGAQDGRRYGCLLTYPSNQGRAFCVSALQPVIDHITKEKQESNICEVKFNETLVQLDQIKRQLSATQTQLENQQTSFEENLKNLIPQDLDERLNRIESKQTALSNQLTAAEEKTDNQLTTMQKALSKMDRNIVLQNFERIGTRLFYIEHKLKVNWRTAEKICMEIGGHLAAFENNQEYNAITAKLSKSNYWLGINDLDRQGTFISLASGKRAPYLWWRSDEPKYNDSTQHCAYIYDGRMIVLSCVNDVMHFICQADDEV